MSTREQPFQQPQGSANMLPNGAAGDHPLALLMRRWTMRSSLSASDRDALASLALTRRSVQRGAYIVHEGEAVTHCSVLISGFVARQKLVNTGNRQIVAIHLPGELVDAQNLLLDRADDSVQSIGQSEVAMIPKSAILDLIATRPEIGRAIWLDTIIDASITREWVVNLGRRDARARIAHLLCELYLRLQAIGQCPSGQCMLPLSQEQIADCMGLTPVHVNRVLQMLRADGLIALRAHRLTILDWAQLTQVGDFDGRYLHDRIQA